jgi:hypothetical protein
VQGFPSWERCNLKIGKGLSFRSAPLSREESAVSLLAASTFLADKAGFGMTRGIFVQTVSSPP